MTKRVLFFLLFVCLFVFFGKYISFTIQSQRLISLQNAWKIHCFNLKEGGKKTPSQNTHNTKGNQIKFSFLINVSTLKGERITLFTSRSLNLFQFYGSDWCSSSCNNRDILCGIVLDMWLSFFYDLTLFWVSTIKFDMKTNPCLHVIHTKCILKSNCWLLLLSGIQIVLSRLRCLVLGGRWIRWMPAIEGCGLWMEVLNFKGITDVLFIFMHNHIYICRFSKKLSQRKSWLYRTRHAYVYISSLM